MQEENLLDQSRGREKRKAVPHAEEGFVQVQTNGAGGVGTEEARMKARKENEEKDETDEKDEKTSRLARLVDPQTFDRRPYSGGGACFPVVRGEGKDFCLGFSNWVSCPSRENEDCLHDDASPTAVGTLPGVVHVQFAFGCTGTHRAWPRWIRGHFLVVLANLAHQIVEGRIDVQP